MGEEFDEVKMFVLKDQLDYDCQPCKGHGRYYDWYTGAYEQKCESCEGTGYSMIPRYYRRNETLNETANNMVKLAKYIGIPISLKSYDDIVISPDDTIKIALAKLAPTVHQ